MNCSFPPWAVKGHCLQAIAEPSPTPGCQIPPCVPQHCPRGTSPHASLSQLLTASPPTSALLTRSPTVGASPEPLVAGFHPLLGFIVVLQLKSLLAFQREPPTPEASRAQQSPWPGQSLHIPPDPGPSSAGLMAGHQQVRSSAAKP